MATEGIKSGGSLERREQEVGLMWIREWWSNEEEREEDVMWEREW